MLSFPVPCICIGGHDYVGSLLAKLRSPTAALVSQIQPAYSHADFIPLLKTGRGGSYSASVTDLSVPSKTLEPTQPDGHASLTPETGHQLQYQGSVLFEKLIFGMAAEAASTIYTARDYAPTSGRLVAEAAHSLLAEADTAPAQGHHALRVCRKRAAEEVYACLQVQASSALPAQLEQWTVGYHQSLCHPSLELSLHTSLSQCHVVLRFLEHPTLWTPCCDEPQTHAGGESAAVRTICPSCQCTYLQTQLRAINMPDS